MSKTRYGIVERAYLNTMMGVMKRSMSLSLPREFHRLFVAEVASVQDVAPRVRRLRLAAPEFASYQALAPDDYFGLLMPKAGAALVMPPGEKLNLRAELNRMPEETRPDLRWYTIRSLDRERSEIAVDIVIHADGPGGAFLARVAPGDQVGFREGNGAYPGQGGKQLLVGDETAVPALSAIAEAVTDGSDIRALIEVPSADFVAPFEAPFEIQWLYRGEEKPGSKVLPALQGALAPVDYAWLCGEQGMVKDARRLVVEAGTDKRNVLFSGYWRLGHARP